MLPRGNAKQQTHRALLAMLCVSLGQLLCAGMTCGSYGTEGIEHVPQRPHAPCRNAVQQSPGGKSA